MTKQTPAWGKGGKVAKPVAPAPAKGHPVRQTPAFVPEQAPGAPAAPGIGKPARKPGTRI